MNLVIAEESGELVTLDTNEIMDGDVVNRVRIVLRLGQNTFKCFVGERFEHKAKAIGEPLQKNKVLLMSRKSVSAKKAHVTVLKDEVDS